VAEQLLIRMRDGLASQGVVLQQVLLHAAAPTIDQMQAVLQRAEFEFLAELRYLERRLEPGRVEYNPEQADELSWQAYCSANHALFTRVVQGTYEGSRDCPGLTGRRTIEDVLATHRAAGRFRPERWLLAEYGEKPAGCLLMVRAAFSNALDVAYMGLLPWARGRGWGRLLFVKAQQLAREAGAARLTLTVDKANVPAMKLYEGCGLRAVCERRAWVFPPAARPRG
jgi:ribosomal protein S18 acetylase RimI-like enzyme